MGMKQQAQECTRCANLVSSGGYAYPLYQCTQKVYSEELEWYFWEQKPEPGRCYTFVPKY